MRLISRHILRTLVAPFVWGVVALTGLLLLNSLPPLIDRFGGKGIDFRTVAEGVLLITPSLTALTLPMAVLVSVLYGYSRLAADLEMVAMYANGISVWRMARPALLGAAGVAVVNFLVLDQLMPKSNARFTNLSFAVQQKLPTLALRQQVLNVLPARTGYILRADAIDPETGGMRQVTIFDLTDNNSEQVRRLILADSGTMEESVDGKDLILTLHSGEIYEFRPNEPGRLQQINYVHNRIVVRDVQNGINLSPTGRMRSEREMSGCELLDQLDEQQWQGTNARQEAEYYTRSDLHSLAVLAPALRPAEPPHPTFREHCGAYRRFESWFKGIMLPQKAAAQQPPPPAAQQPAAPVVAAPQTPVVAQPAPAQQFLVPPTGQVPGPGMLTPLYNVLNVEARTNQARSNTLIYQVEFHQKFAVPLSCFCFVLIGMALALKYPGGGIGLVIGGSLVIFLGFYILLQGGRGAARAGELNPLVAAYVPLLLFTAIGIVSVNSANREMGMTRSGGILDIVLGLLQGRKG